MEDPYTTVITAMCASKLNATMPYNDCVAPRPDPVALTISRLGLVPTTGLIGMPSHAGSGIPAPPESRPSPGFLRPIALRVGVALTIMRCRFMLLPSQLENFIPKIWL